MRHAAVKQYSARLWIERLAHPLILAMALACWGLMDGDELAVIPALALTLIAASLLERWVPAMPDWRQSSGERWRLGALYLLTFVLLGVVPEIYKGFLLPLFEPLREAVGTSLWPGQWPLLVQGLILFFASDLIYYWIHRAIHRYSFLWRASGHGFHHAFHNLHALNVNATHPFEILFLALPMVILAALFNAPLEATSAALVLLSCNATLAHANVSMNTPVLSWFFTHSNHHRRHHSMDFDTSNTNYACNAIVWDRVFGTYSNAPVTQTGIGPVQPGIRQMFLLPFREPEQADTVSTRRVRRYQDQEL